MTRSIHTRLLLASALVLTLFLGATGWVLERAFHDAAEQALRDRLQAQAYTLLAAAELDASDRMQLPPDLPEPRFSIAGSGLYAEVARADGESIWRSASALGMALAFRANPSIGERIFGELAAGPNDALLGLSLGVAWPDSKGRPHHYIFRVAENRAPVAKQVRAFRRGLWGWLAGAAIVLLAVQGAVLRWGLTPLRAIARDLATVEAGHAEQLRGDYPRELRGLTQNLNVLLASTRAHLARYRDALANLAHSLKTPLAVLHGVIDAARLADDERRNAREQLTRMHELVEYHLARAATAGRNTLGAPLPVAPLITKITGALARVYAGKAVDLTMDIPPQITFRGDEGDLLEIAGNLADNAYKWCRARVRIRAHEIMLPDERRQLELVFEDDGPGIAPEDAERLSLRGERADPATPGHGIGLAVVTETVRLYRGELLLARSALGGASITVRL